LVQITARTQPFWARFFVVFLSLSRQCWDNTALIGHNHFFPNSSFIYHPTIRCYILSILKELLNNPQTRRWEQQVRKNVMQKEEHGRK
jgi:hypothetical protein